MNEKSRLLNMEFYQLQHGESALMEFTAQGMKLTIIPAKVAPKHEPEVVQARSRLKECLDKEVRIWPIW